MTKQIEGLVARLRDCEMSLAIWDAVRNSEYWLRHPEPITESTRSGVVDEALLEQIWADELRHHGCDGALTTPTIAIHRAALSAMRRVSKTDEGRNAVSDGDNNDRG